MADPTWTDREAQLLAQRAILLGTVEHLKADVARLTREREEARAGLKHQASDYTIRCEQLAEARAALAASERREAALREVLRAVAVKDSRCVYCGAEVGLGYPHRTDPPYICGLARALGAEGGGER